MKKDELLPKYNEKKPFITPKEALISSLAGVVSGFFGAGGGVILVFGWALLGEKEEKDTFAKTTFVTAVLSAVSASVYSLNYSLSFSKALQLMLPAALGGVAGALLMNKMPSKLLRRIFGAISMLGGIIMMTR